MLKDAPVKKLLIWENMLSRYGVAVYESQYECECGELNCRYSTPFMQLCV